MAAAGGRDATAPCHVRPAGGGAALALPPPPARAEIHVTWPRTEENAPVSLAGAGRACTVGGVGAVAGRC